MVGAKRPKISCRDAIRLGLSTDMPVVQGRRAASATESLMDLRAGPIDEFEVAAVAAEETASCAHVDSAISAGFVATQIDT